MTVKAYVTGDWSFYSLFGFERVALIAALVRRRSRTVLGTSKPGYVVLLRICMKGVT